MRCPRSAWNGQGPDQTVDLLLEALQTPFPWARVRSRAPGLCLQPGIRKCLSPGLEETGYREVRQAGFVLAQLLEK